MRPLVLSQSKKTPKNCALPGEGDVRLDKFSICIIGAGPGGIAAGVMLQRAGLRNFTVFEKGSRPGGTWYHNRYPGAACDVQSQLYSYSFKPKYDWSRINAMQPEILEYLEDTASEYGITERCRFDTGITELKWSDKEQLWDVKSEAGETFRFNAVITCVGLLNDPKLPTLPGMDEFAGLMMHTARWKDVDLTGKRVAVIGTGSSSAQIVKSIGPRVGHLTVYQREPGWVIPNDDRDILPEEMAELRANPLRARLKRWKIYWQREMAATVVTPGSKVHQARTQTCLDWLESNVDDENVRAALTPDYPFNCKRPVRDPDYLRTYNLANVQLIDRAVTRFTKNGVIATDGIERPADVVILATGFNAAEFLSTLKVTGRDGEDLHAFWNSRGGPEAFLGVTTERFPNMFMFYGPNSNSSTGSIIFVLECQARYAADAIRKMVRRGWSSIEVRPAAQRLFNRWLQAKASKTTWVGGCHNYYSAPSGKVVTNWPFSSVIYWGLLRSLRVGVPLLYSATRATRSSVKVEGIGSLAQASEQPRQ
jgi:cation diffusion facilitator CzcD-associated flavoprotein CzcO